MVKRAKAQEKKKMQNLKRKTPVLVIALILAFTVTAYAVTRYILTKPATVQITTVDNAYEIETFVDNEVITVIPFTGTIIENDPSRPTTTIESVRFIIRKLDFTSGETYYLSVESEQVDLYCTLNEATYLEGELYQTDAKDTYCKIYINGLDLNDDGRTDIEIQILVDDGI